MKPMRAHQDDAFLQNYFMTTLEQQIGKHYRCYRRNSSTCWKGNWGDLKFEEHELTERHKVWIDESARVFGYDLDICALDVLHLKDGREVVLEV